MVSAQQLTHHAMHVLCVQTSAMTRAVIEEVSLDVMQQVGVA
jgi:hypothetical protein